MYVHLEAAMVIYFLTLVELNVYAYFLDHVCNDHIISITCIAVLHPIHGRSPSYLSSSYSYYLAHNFVVHFVYNIPSLLVFFFIKLVHRLS